MARPKKTLLQDYRDGWTPLHEGYPEAYALVTLLFEDGWKQPMWWTGQEWDGRRKMRDVPVVAWKKITHVY